MSAEKTSALPHPPNDRFVPIRSWFLNLCDGNELATKLISFFEYQVNLAIANNENAIKHFEGKLLLGEIPERIPNLWRRLGQENIREGILSTASRSSILKQITYLEVSGIILCRDIVNPNYQFDRRKSYLFRPWRVCELYQQQAGNELAYDVSLYEKLNDPYFVDDSQVIDFMKHLPKDNALYKFTQCIDQNYTKHCLNLDPQCVNLDTQCINLHTQYNRSKGRIQP